MKLDPIVKATWIEALESDEYEKGKGLLRSKDDKYCCLGVYCDIFGNESWKESASGRGYGYDESNTTKGELATAFLPKSLAGDFSKHDQDKLTLLNDSSDTFAPVIEYIKEKL